jgi:hypothetical protein
MIDKIFYRFAYTTKPNRDNDLRPHMLRDGDAYAHLGFALIQLGYSDGELKINHPLRPGVSDTSLEDMAHLSEQDLLVILTRPPLNDPPPTQKKSNIDSRHIRPNHPSLTRFEQQVLFPELRNYLINCSRDEIQLRADQAQMRLEPGYANRDAINFYMRPDERFQRYEASYRFLGRAPGAAHTPNRTTAAYLIHTEPLKRPDGTKGPRVLVAFGVSGTIGLVFAYQLRWQRKAPFQGLLKEALSAPGISMVEIEVTRDVPRFYTNLSFSNDWEYKLITRRPSLVATAGPS